MQSINATELKSQLAHYLAKTALHLMLRAARQNN